MDTRQDRTSVEARAWLRALFEEAPIAIGVARDGVSLDANAAYLRLFGYGSVAEMRGASIFDSIAPSHRAQIQERMLARARGERPPERYPARGLRKDGTEFPLELVTTRVVVADGPLNIAFISDISEREEIFRAMQAGEERFRILSAAAFEGVFVHAEGRVLFANETGAAMYGVDPESMVGVPLSELIASESRATLKERLARGAEEPADCICRRMDGSTFIAEVRARTLVHQGRPMRVAVTRDVTDHRRMEAEQRALSDRVRHTQKLESLGVLAGGVAHDFNNILTIISNGVALARRESDLGPGAATHLETVSLAVERAADLCRQMLAYAGKAQLERTPVDLSALAREMASMLEASISQRATLTQDLAAELPPLLGDGTQIRQVLMNLVLNASEAIAEPPGSIRVSTGCGVYDAAAFAHCTVPGVARAGSYAWLEVRDDGAGMDAATLAQIFDPFFTTKFVGRGLGMAAVLGIVRGHEGAIDVESSPGRGTRVRAFFPILEAGPAVALKKPEEGLRGEGVVLLVDDEKNVRFSTELLLKGLGFGVVAARDGAEALEALRSERGQFNAMLLDLTMPRMDGIQVLKEVRHIAPHLPVVLSTGAGAMPLEAKPDAVLPKPYTASALLQTLLEVMKK